jgi:hypothetical protein
MTNKRWITVTAVVVSATALTTAYLTIVGFTDPDSLLPGAGTHAGRTLSLYEAVRSTVLVGALVVALVRRAWRPLRLLLLLNGLTQLGDAAVGATAQHSFKDSIAPLCFAILLLICAWRPPTPGMKGLLAGDDADRNGEHDRVVEEADDAVHHHVPAEPVSAHLNVGRRK